MSVKRHSADRGFTLIELIIGIVLSGVVGGVIVAALFTSLNVFKSTTGQIADSTDAGLLSTFLFRDAQSAGATDPSTAGADSTVGVSTTDWGGCTQTGSSPAPVVRFSWIDHITSVTQRRVVVTYGLAAKQLTRRICTWANAAAPTMTSSTDTPLARNIGSVIVTCAPAADPKCTGQPISVSLAVTGSNDRSPLAYTLTATLRTRPQERPTNVNSLPIPVLVLDGDSATPCPNITLSGAGTIRLLGTMLSDATCGATPVVGATEKSMPSSATSSIAGITDPYANRVPPVFTCPASGGTNPPIGVNTARDGENAVVVYPQRVTIIADVTFAPGRYVFCHGLAIDAGSITGTGVLLYVADPAPAIDGLLSIAAAATIDLTPPMTGPNSSLLIWVASSQPVAIESGARVNNLRGVIYAPRSELTMRSAATTHESDIGGIIVKKLVINTSGRTRLGLPMPVLVIAPTALTGLPPAQVGVAYSAPALSVAGGTAPFEWKMPEMGGLSINSAGQVSGTPTISGTSTLTVTAVDATGAAESIDYLVTVAPQLIITGPASLPPAQAGIVLPPTRVTTTGGTAPFSWTATGLPTGLVIDAASGTITGRPTTAGQFTFTITVRDALAGTSSVSSTITVSAAPTVTGPASLPAGRVGVAYVATTVTGTGGTPPYSWAATGLPPGLSLASGTGSLSGTPTAAGSFNVVVTLTDALGGTATKTFPVAIAAAGPATCPTTIAGWRGEYFANRTLIAPSSLCRDDANIAFSWGAGSPAPSIPVDVFSVRWTRTITFAAGDYVFSMGTDDGGRLFIDGVLVLDLFVYQSYPNPIPTVRATLAAGPHTIVMEYFEGNGSAQATLTWAPQLVTPAGCPTSPAGWSGAYYANDTLAGTPGLCRDDAAINFDWGTGPPVAGGPSDNFSVRWTRTQNFAAGRYTFALGTDDGGRLYVDGVLVIDRFVDQAYPNPVPTAIVDLTAGAHTIMVEYYERGGSAAAILTWAPTPA